MSAQDVIMSLLTKNRKAIFVIIFVLLLDQFTKYLVYKFLFPDKVIKLLPFLNLVYVENTGIAFGMFKSLPAGFFIVVTTIITFFVIYLFFKDRQNWFVYSLIIAGALGNTADRIIHGYVIDFIDLHAWVFHWPAFNVADSAISIGVVLFIYKSFKK